MVARSFDLVPGCLGSSRAASRADEFAGTFELYKDARGEYHFHLKAPNGEIIASSGSYESKAAAEKGIRSVQRAVRGATILDQTD
ncbi:MAG: DUF1508 domain-containing protein [Mycobacterium sp.]|nr:DUF1508 domain-containing protein [Mycobacterium sp.]